MVGILPLMISGYLSYVPPHNFLIHFSRTSGLTPKLKSFSPHWLVALCINPLTQTQLLSKLVLKVSFTKGVSFTGLHCTSRKALFWNKSTIGLIILFIGCLVVRINADWLWCRCMVIPGRVKGVCKGNMQD